jgi:cold shock CspA family protein
MAYKTDDRVYATLARGPYTPGTGFGFAQPVDGGEEIFIPNDVMSRAGLTTNDVGLGLMLIMREHAEGRPAYAAVAMRDDTVVFGEVPDPIESTILNRLHMLERQMGRAIHLLKEMSEGRS